MSLKTKTKFRRIYGTKISSPRKHFTRKRSFELRVTAKYVCVCILIPKRSPRQIILHLRTGKRVTTRHLCLTAGARAQTTTAAAVEMSDRARSRLCNDVTNAHDPRGLVVGGGGGKRRRDPFRTGRRAWRVPRIARHYYRVPPPTGRTRAIRVRRFIFFLFQREMFWPFFAPYS